MESEESRRVCARRATVVTGVIACALECARMVDVIAADTCIDCVPVGVGRSVAAVI